VEAGRRRRPSARPPWGWCPCSRRPSEGSGGPRRRLAGGSPGSPRRSEAAAAFPTAAPRRSASPRTWRGPPPRRGRRRPRSRARGAPPAHARRSATRSRSAGLFLPLCRPGARHRDSGLQPELSPNDKAFPELFPHI
jgi:hypothetical protein